MAITDIELFSYDLRDGIEEVRKLTEETVESYFENKELVTYDSDED